MNINIIKFRDHLRKILHSQIVTTEFDTCLYEPQFKALRSCTPTNKFIVSISIVMQQPTKLVLDISSANGHYEGIAVDINGSY